MTKAKIRINININRAKFLEGICPPDAIEPFNKRLAKFHKGVVAVVPKTNCLAYLGASNNIEIMKTAHINTNKMIQSHMFDLNGLYSFSMSVISRPCGMATT